MKGGNGELMYNQMVVSMLAELTDDDTDRIFHALADRTRRDIVMRSLTAENSVSELASRYDMSFAAVQKHVAVLEKAGLVTKLRSGRERLVRGDVEVIRRAGHLLAQYEQVWQGRVTRMDALLAEHRDQE